MAYDEELAHRLRALLSAHAPDEKRMFGGLAFLVGGHMTVAASRTGGLMLRVDPARSGALATQEHVGRMVMQGREMDGWLLVDPAGVAADADLERFVAIALEFVATLPAK